MAGSSFNQVTETAFPASLSNLGGASNTGNVANSIYLQSWNWSLTNITGVGFEVGESSASTAGNKQQYLSKFVTVANSTASPARWESRTSGIASVSPSGDCFDFEAGVRIRRVPITSNYNVSLRDYLIAITSTATNVTVTMPDANLAGTGRVYVVKDEGGNASVTGIAVTGTSSQTFDGALGYKLTSNYGATRFYSDGKNWFIESSDW